MRIVGFLFLLFNLAIASIAGGAQVSINEVISGLEDVEATAKGFKVDVKYERDSEHSAPGSSIVSNETTFLQDSSGRFRVERLETRLLKIDGKQFEAPISVIAVFDGTSTKQMEGRGRFTTGRLSGDAGGMPWGGSPRAYLTHYFDTPVSQLIKEQRAEIVGGEKESILIVETKGNFVERDRSTRKYRFLIDVGKNYSVVERSVLIKPDGSDKFYAYGRTISVDHQRTASGVWVPTRAVDESINVDDVINGNSKKSALNFRNEFTFSNWDLLPDLDEATFELEFAEGIAVTDLVLGKTYDTPGTLTDHGISQFMFRENDTVKKDGARAEPHE